MKKKSLFIILLVICVGYSIPTGVFANGVYNNINIDYKFFIDDSEQDGNFKFKLYDKSSFLEFDSKYDSSNKYYYFEYNENNYKRAYPPASWGYLWNDFGDYEEYFRPYVPYINDSSVISYNVAPILENLASEKYLMGKCLYEWDMTCSFYTYIPMIIEGTNNDYKHIVLASINIRSLNDGWFHTQLYFVNNKASISVDDISLGNSLSDNISFMRNAIYDYSDELWEELNSGPIASSEMQYDNSDNDLSSPKTITLKTNNDKAIYSKYKSNVNYRFKVKNGNGMNFKLHDVSNTFSFSSQYDKDSDAYSIVDNSSDSDYQDGIKEFSKIIVDEVKNGNFNGLSSKYKSITSDNCSSTSCDITTYIPLILEGENNGEMAKQIVLGLMNIQYREDSGNDYYDVSLNVYNNTCDLLNSNIDLDMNKLINLSRSIEEDYSNDLMDKYSNGSISLEDISKNEDINSLKDKYCEDVPVISLRKVSNPKTWNSGVIVLIISMIMVIGSGMFIIKKKV